MQNKNLYTLKTKKTGQINDFAFTFHISAEVKNRAH